jgi:chemotaxis family two-component system response regulator Rcp1
MRLPMDNVSFKPLSALPNLRAAEEEQPVAKEGADLHRMRRVPGQAFIVLVDDNPADVLLVREALAWHGVISTLLVAEDGDEAIRYIDEIDAASLPCPDLIVLDLNLPKKTGFQVLERLRASPMCGGRPAAILSSSAAAADRKKAERLGASCYICKPSNLDDFLSIGKELKQMLPDQKR